MSPEAQLLSKRLINQDWECIKSWAARTNGTVVMSIMVEVISHPDTIIDDRDFGDLAREMGILCSLKNVARSGG